MNPRARQFAQAQTRAALRDRAVEAYLYLRLKGWSTREAWEAASVYGVRPR